MAHLHLAHNERHPVSASLVAKVIHNFGRAESIDRAAPARLVSSISRFLTPEQAVSAAAGAEVKVLDSRHLGGGVDVAPGRGTARDRGGGPPGRGRPPSGR